MNGLGTELGTTALLLFLAMMGFIVRLLRHVEISPLDVLKTKNRDHRNQMSNTGILKRLDDIDSNSKPGKSQPCIDNGKMLAQHEIIIKQLCKETDEEKVESRKFRDRVREDFQTVFKKIDRLSEKF